MKKKIALLLAVIMTLSLMPMTVFAGSTNYLAKGTLTLKKDTKYDGSASGKRIENGLVIEFKDTIRDAAGQKFRIELTNAEFSNVYDASNSTSSGGFVAAEESGAVKLFTYAGDPTIGKATRWSTQFAGMIPTVAPSPASGQPNVPGVGAALPRVSNSISAKVTPEGLSNVATVTVYQADAGSKMTIFLPIKTKNVDDADVSVSVIANNSYVSANTFLISKTASGSTTTQAKDIETGRELLELENIIIKESIIGSLKNLYEATDGATPPVRTGITGFELLAPSGYEFVTKDNINVVGTGEFASLRGTVGIKADKSSLFITLNGNSLNSATSGRSTILPESIIVAGAKIQPIDDDAIPYGTELMMNIYKYAPSGGEALDGLTEQSFVVAKPVDWTISVTAATATDVVTGRYDNRIDANGQVAAKVTFKELIPGAWISQRTTDFVLPEGVSVRGVKFDSADWKNMEQNAPSSTFNTAPSINKDKWSVNLTPNTTGSSYTTNTLTGILQVDKNVLSLKNLSVIPTKKGEMSFTLYLSVSPEYKEDTIALSTGGTAIMQDETPDVVIANATQPIKVSVSKVADVQIGFQRYAVGDITIEETKAGAILRNADVKFLNTTPLAADAEQGLELTIEDYISSDIDLVPIKESQVTVDGDLKITLRKNTTTAANTGKISFDVDRVSTKPSKITIKDVEIKINRSVPYGVYDLVVSGQSVFANKANPTNATPQINGLFDVYGYSVPYINVATEGFNSPLKSNVKIAKDSDIVIVDGVQQQMAYPTYYDASQESFLVPARFISHIFGVEENNIFWNDTTKTVSIITANRTIQFTADSNVMVVGANGAPSNVTMTAKAILHPVTERLYVPFRAIGDAFGVPVSYDEATQMGEYNAVVK